MKMIVDKSEKNIFNKAKFKKVDKILEEEFEGQTGLGLCHIKWLRKKQLLKEMYNIDWKSPAELNPWINFD